MTGRLLAVCMVVGLLAASAAAATAPSLTANDTTVSGCGYPTDSQVLVLVREKHWGDVLVNFEPASTDTAGCFSYMYASTLSRGNYTATVFYGDTPYEQFKRVNFQIR